MNTGGEFAEGQTNPAYKTIIESDTKLIEPEEYKFSQFLLSLGVPQEQAEDLTLGFVEALNNAIEHGNKGIKDKKVTIEYSMDHQERELVVEITDQGQQPFDFNQVPDPTQSENLLNEGGRGVFLYRARFDSPKTKVQRTEADDGNTVILVKKFDQLS